MGALKNRQGSENSRGQGARIPEERGARKGWPGPCLCFPLLLAVSEARRKTGVQGLFRKRGPRKQSQFSTSLGLLLGVGANRKPEKPGFDSAPSLIGLR